MVPQALEPYVEQLAKHGPGSYSMPKVGWVTIMFTSILDDDTLRHLRSFEQLFPFSLSPLA